MRTGYFDIVVGLILFCLIATGLFGMFAFVLTSLLIFILILTTNKSTAGVFLIWIFFDVSGLWSEIFGIPKAGLISLLLAIFCFYITKFNHLIDYKRPIFLFFPVILIFSLFFVYGPMHSYSYEKYIFIIYKGIFFIIAFLVLLLNGKINYIKLSLLILLGAFQYFSYVVLKSDWTGVEGLFDFGSLRRFYSANHMGVDERIVNYQSIGMMATLSFSFILNIMPSKYSSIKNDVLFYIITVISILFILYTGSRQSLYSIPLIFIGFLILTERYSKKSKYYIFALCSALFVTFVVFETEKNESNLVLSQGSSLLEKLNRPAEMTRAFELIVENPLLGTGLGGFAFDVENSRYYPHNIFLELLSEIGLIGTCLIIVYFFFLLKSRKFSLKSNSNSGFLILPVFLSLFARANLSSDLIETVFIFSFLIAWASLYKFNNNLIVYENS